MPDLRPVDEAVRLAERIAVNAARLKELVALLKAEEGDDEPEG